MPITYERIASTTLNVAAANITFSSIPATYTDLRLVFVGTGTASPGLYGRFNNDSTALYSFTEMFGNGSNVFSSRVANISYIDLESQTNLSPTTPQFKTIDIFSYTGSTFKTYLYNSNDDRNGSGNSLFQAGLYRSTSAINQISLYVNTSTIAVGSTASLYGIKAA